MKRRQIDVIDFSLSYDTLSVSRGYDDSAAMLVSVIKPRIENPEFLFKPTSASTESTAPIKYTWKI
jgi:hypothetical protein